MDRRTFLFERRTDPRQPVGAAPAADVGFSRTPSIEPYQGDWSRPEVYHLLTGHDPSDNEVYGRGISGRTEGLGELVDLLDVIFEREETARYVIRKLYRFFVYTDTTLTPVLRTLLLSDHFYDPALRGATIKSPVDLMAGTIRGMTPAPITGEPSEFASQYVGLRATELEQNLFHPPGVQGWSFYRSWISSTTLPAGEELSERLVSEMTSGRPYEWEDLDDPSKEIGLRRMLSLLMRSAHYQLM